MLGNHIVQGETECELKNGRAIFEKVQINEVTSKFINGSMCIMIWPKLPNNYHTTVNSLEKEKDIINVNNIKPLMLERVIVKSKIKKHMK